MKQVTRYIRVPLKQLITGKSVTVSVASVVSPRLKQVIEGVADGKTCKGIAFDLGVKERTVESYKQRLYKRFGLNSTAALTRWAIRNKIIRP